MEKLLATATPDPRSLAQVVRDWATGHVGMATVGLIVAVESYRWFGPELWAASAWLAGWVLALMVLQAAAMVGALGNRHWGHELGRFTSLLLAGLLLLARAITDVPLPQFAVGCFCLAMFVWCWLKMRESIEGEPWLAGLGRPLPNSGGKWRFLGRFEHDPYQLITQFAGGVLLALTTCGLIASLSAGAFSCIFILVACPLLMLLSYKLLVAEPWAAIVLLVLMIVAGLGVWFMMQMIDGPPESSIRGGLVAWGALYAAVWTVKRLGIYGGRSS